MFHGIDLPGTVSDTYADATDGAHHRYAPSAFAGDLDVVHITGTDADTRPPVISTAQHTSDNPEQLVLLIQHRSGASEITSSIMSPALSRSPAPKPSSSVESSPHSDGPRQAWAEAASPARRSDSTAAPQWAMIVNRAFLGGRRGSQVSSQSAYQIYCADVPTIGAIPENYSNQFAERVVEVLMHCEITESDYAHIKAVFIEANLMLPGECPALEDIEANIRFLANLFPTATIVFFSGGAETGGRKVNEVYPQVITTLEAAGVLWEHQAHYFSKIEFTVANIKALNNITSPTMVSSSTNQASRTVGESMQTLTTAETSNSASGNAASSGGSSLQSGTHNDASQASGRGSNTTDRTTSASQTTSGYSIASQQAQVQPLTWYQRFSRKACQCFSSKVTPAH